MPRGVIEGSVRIAGGKIAQIRLGRGARRHTINLRGAYLAPGFIDLHVWGPPEVVSRDCARYGTTAFLSAIGPEPPARTRERLIALRHQRIWPAASCLGAHLEGPFLNPRRAGALPARWMRRATAAQLQALGRAGPMRLMTLAPELPGAMEAIRWCHRRGIVTSLGHTNADAKTARRAVAAGARAVTHVFNGMRPFHHRQPGLIDVALAESRLTTMVILDGVHIAPVAFQLLVRTKGPKRMALVTDSIRRQGWKVQRQAGAYYLSNGTLAGSGLTMMSAVRNAMRFGNLSVHDAVRMASEVPARLLRDRSRGVLAVGKRADVVVFDQRFRVRLTMIGGRIVYEQEGR